MAELPGCNEYSIKELMRLRIPGLCLMQDLADVVDRHLDGLDFASETGSFSLSWGLTGPQIFWLFPGSGPGRTTQSKVGCHFGGGRTSTSMLITSVIAARYRNSISPGSGATRTGREVRYCFISWKSCSASSVHVN
jgi:hypothetical protein